MFTAAKPNSNPNLLTVYRMILHMKRLSLTPNINYKIALFDMLLPDPILPCADWCQQHICSWVCTRERSGWMVCHYACPQISLRLLSIQHSGGSITIGFSSTLMHFRLLSPLCLLPFRIQTILDIMWLLCL